MSERNDRLQRKIAEYFSSEDLQGLCFSLSIPFDELEGGTKSARIRSLIHYVEKRNLTSALIAKLNEERPTVNWDGSPTDGTVCPYRGLLAFREQDASLFFGRSQVANDLVTAVLDQPLVAIIGPSGSGKSSILFAGVLPRLRQRGHWLTANSRPGANPFLTFARSLVPLLLPTANEIDAPAEARKLAGYLRDDKIPLSDYTAQILEKQPADSQILFLLDQFEELFTQCANVELRHQFLDMLLDAIQNDKQPVKIVLTMRADFMGQALAYRPFADALQPAVQLLGPMNREELLEAIEKPLVGTPISFEAGLTARILDDVGEELGNLPLLEFALDSLWQYQENGLLTHMAYEEIGKVDGALAVYADNEYNKLNAIEKEQARRLFIQLVQPGAGTEDTRRSATRQELSEPAWQLTQAMADSRLVVTGQNAEGQETVEVAHEALLCSWEQLQKWMDEDRTFRAWQERLRQSEKQWQISQQDDGALLRGIPLAEAENWLAERADEIGPAETAYIAQSLSSKQAREEAEEEQRQNELKLTRASARRSRRFSIVLGIFFIIALVISGFAYYQLTIARGRGMAGNAQGAYARGDYRLAALLGMEAQSLLRASIGEDFLVDNNQMLLAQLPLNFTRAGESLVGHSDTVNSVAWSNEGILASGADDNTIIVWDLESRAPAHILSGHTHTVRSVDWSHEGVLASGSGDGSVIIWDLGKNMPAQTLTGHTNWVLSVAWSKEGELASGSSDGTIIIWDLENGIPNQILTGHTGTVSSVAWSKEGELASSSSDGTVIIWNLKSGIPSQTLEGHTRKVRSVAWSDKGTLASGSDDKSVIIWDLVNGTPDQILTGHTGQVRSVAWSNEEELASGLDDTTVNIWELESGTLAHTLTGHTGNVNSVTWSDKGVLTSGSGDGSVIIWDKESATPTQTLTEHASLITSIAWSKEGNLASGSFIHDFVIWDLESGNPIQSLKWHEGIIVNSIDWSHEGVLASGSGDGSVITWDLENGTPDQILTGHTGMVNSVAWSDEGILASSSDNGSVIIWDLVNSTPDQILTGHTGQVRSVAWSGEGILATGSRNGSVIIWDLVNGTPDQILTGHTGMVNSVAWSDEGILASGSGDGSVIIWDLVNGTPEQILTGHTGTVNSVDWSKEEKLASGSIDGMAIIWDLENGTPFQALNKSTGWVNSVSWSDKGELALGISEGSIIIVPKWMTEHTLCDMVIRNLSEGEWESYIGVMSVYESTCPNISEPTITNPMLTWSGRLFFVSVIFLGIAFVTVYFYIMWWLVKRSRAQKAIET